ncbi:MAG: hypothetical protein J6331_00465 [Lentisphaeria bacterium]|nr:hypothetical protein [Lentisphaeria bacterium]
MGVFREKNPPLFLAALFLAAAFLCCYPLTELGKLELFRDEGLYAAMALETASFPPVSRAHGEVVAYTYPLYPLLVKGLHSLGLSMEFSLRILSVSFLALLSLVVGFACFQAAFLNSMMSLTTGVFSPEEVRKNAAPDEVFGSEEALFAPLTESERKKESIRTGFQAGAVGSSLIFATVLSGEKAIDGDPVVLTSLLVYGGWLLWFRMGAGRDSWNAAWLCAFLAASAAFYNGGWYALGFFFLPMLFLKRPLKIFTRLRYPGFYAGLFLLFCTVLFWEIPRWDGTLAASAESAPLSSFGKYLKDVAYMPLDLCLRFLPWTFFLYAPWCPALTAIDRNRLFMKFLRRLLLFALLFFWFNPMTQGRDFLLIAPVLATLTALDYWIVVRRYGEALCRVLSWISPVMGACGLVMVFFYLLPGGMMARLTGKFFDLSFLKGASPASVPFLLAVLIPVAAAGAWIFAVWKKHRCVWLSLLFLFCGMMSFFWAFTVPFRCAGQVKKSTALAMRKALGEAYSPEMTIYKDGGISGLYDEGFYLGTKIRLVRSPREITEEKGKNIFVLSAKNLPPGDAQRTWSRLMELDYKNRKLYIWKGALNVRKYSQEEESIRRMRF